MRRLGITGGMGSGKSFVCRVFSEEFGVPVFDCDREAKRLMRSEPSIRERLVELVGGGVYDADGMPDKAVLAAYLFASAANAARVNAIVHPHVRSALRGWYGRQRAGVVCVESAILCESGFDAEVDEVLFVDAPLEMRVRRAMGRDGMTRREVLARMERQDVSLARIRARHILLNGDGATKETITNQIKEKILC